METLAELRKRGRALSAAVRVGQRGLTESAIQEIKAQLKHKKLIKIKFLRNFMEDSDKKAAVLELVERTDSVLVDFIGFTVVLAKKEIVLGKN